MNESRLEQAFRANPRQNFLPRRYRQLAGNDIPFAIGYGQTNSQPSTVKRMLGWLDVNPGQNVLDVGSGSGWTTALLCYLAGQHGQVTAVELIPQLTRRGQRNCRRLGYTNARFHTAGKIIGWPENAPYDCILVSAGADTLPEELLAQLRRPGRMVIPIRDSIHVIDIDESGRLSTLRHPGYVFVPLISGG